MPGRTRSVSHPIALLVAVGTTAVLLAGCGTAEPNATPASAPSSPSPTYDAEELAVYREAVRRVEDFEARNQPILAAGRATRQAKELYRETLRDWESSYAQLVANERDGIRIARAPVVLGTEATSIQSFQDDAATVVLARCTDQSHLGTTLAGEPLPAVHAEPVIQEVVVRRYENRTWRIGEFTTTDRPCTG